VAELLLTVDTSTPAGSVALTSGESLIGEFLLRGPGTHSDYLLSHLHRLLADVGAVPSQLDGFGVVIGPGSFTGLRVGIATVKGLALALDRPVAPVSSLQTLALNVPFASHPVCALLDARKKEVYAGIYRWEGGLPMALGEERVLSPEKFLESAGEEAIFIGDGALAYRTLIVRQFGSRGHFLPGPLNLPRASAAAILALNRFRAGETESAQTLLPRYLRLSEAEIHWSRKNPGTPIRG